jgi:hypothetical protein
VKFAMAAQRRLQAKVTVVYCRIGEPAEKSS